MLIFHCSVVIVHTMFCCVRFTGLINEQMGDTHLTAVFPGLPGLAGTRKVKLIWILLKQETVSGSGIRWAICKSALQHPER